MEETIQEYLERCPTAVHWKRVGIKPHHGICVPLFSLRTQKSCGIGDFYDLHLLIDWCANVGFDCIQLLPLNDTAEDPSPYNALSSCALDPIYLSLSHLPDVPPELVEQLPLFKPLNDLPRIPHEEVRHQKVLWLRKYFEQTADALERSAIYQNFVQQNPWLNLYTEFKAYKDEYGGKHWSHWPLEKQSPHKANPDPRATRFHSFLQFHAFYQLQEAKNYAEKKSILLKGDVPILLSPDSVDTWAFRPLFDLHYIAGAPPDYYSPLGQKWGFPLFNWEEMRRDHFAWWKQRLALAGQCFHIYRIDHVVGLFRIWAIKETEKASEGRFIPKDPEQWGIQGREILEMMIQASPILPIAEDLGAIPDIVYQTLHDLGICGTKVMRWYRNWKHKGAIIPPKDYEPISLTTISTPDSETLALWWKNQVSEATQLAAFKHWNYTPHLKTWQRLEILHDAHHTASIFHINLLSEYLALFPDLVSPNPEDERINIPGTLLPTNWTYRLKPTLEELLTRTDLQKEIQNIISG